jgi:cell division protein FtsB
MGKVIDWFQFGLTLWLMLNLFSPNTGAISYFQLKHNLLQHQENLAFINSDISALEDQINWLSESEYLGMVARTQWGFVQNGDQQFWVTEEKDES